MSLNRGLLSSERGDWRTPSDLYARVCLIPGRFDVSDTHGGTFNALTDNWPEPWFCNPPYRREIGRWTARMSSAGIGVALLPARTDTEWFHAHVLPYARIEWIRGRLHFDDNGPAPFPSMLARFGAPK